MPNLPEPAAVDAVASRNSTRITILVNGQKVGRVQSFRQDVSNNVQVLRELGNAFAAELKKGVTEYRFSIAKFYARSDVMDALKLGKVFQLQIEDGGETGQTSQVLESFSKCMVDSISRDYVIGQATVAENATVVTIGEGKLEP